MYDGVLLPLTTETGVERELETSATSGTRTRMRMRMRRSSPEERDTYFIVRFS